MNEYKDNATDHLADLVVDEALPLNVEFHKLLITTKQLCRERHDIPLSLGVFGLEIT